MSEHSRQKATRRTAGQLSGGPHRRAHKQKSSSARRETARHCIKKQPTTAQGVASSSLLPEAPLLRTRKISCRTGPLELEEIGAQRTHVRRLSSASALCPGGSLDRGSRQLADRRRQDTPQDCAREQPASTEAGLTPLTRRPTAHQSGHH